MSCKKLSIMICLFIVFISLAGCSDPKSSPEEILANSKNAEIILVALSEYHEEYRSFPESLQDLIPRYIQSIPETQQGRVYEYYLSEIDGYILCFDQCCYLYEDQLWDCSPGE
jgi:hypothetical protein